MLDSLDKEEELCGQDPGWPDYIAWRREQLRLQPTVDGFSPENLKEKANWPTLSVYLQKDDKVDSDHQKLVRRLIFGPWRQYSEIAHVTFRGVQETFRYLNYDYVQQERREQIRGDAERAMSEHLGRAATVLLALLTEIQAAFKFKGHNVNLRLHGHWHSMVQFPEGKDMHNLRYRDLMEARGLLNEPSDS